MLQVSAVAALLSNIIYFVEIASSTMETFVKQCILRTFEAGEIIFLEGNPSEGLWLIKSGRVKVSKMNTDGMEHVIHILGEGNTFNDIAALDGGVCPATAAALSNVEALLLPQSTLAAYLTRDERLARNVINCLTARVRVLVRQIEDLALYSVKVRLARFLLQQAKDSALSGVGVTRATIASYLASTPQTISTLLRELEEHGAITFDRHHIFITNELLLYSIAML